MDHISPQEFDRQFPQACEQARLMNRRAWETQQRERGKLLDDTIKVLDAKAKREIERLVNPPQKRIRQDTKPLLNKTEVRCLKYLTDLLPAGTKIHQQAKKVRLANGCWYLVDFWAIPLKDGPGRLIVNWECKGPHAWEDSLIKLKVAASTYPDEAWFLLWEDGKNNWLSQEVLP